MRWKITISYNGGGFSGWQRQEHNVVTVQGVLEAALQVLEGKPVKLFCAGRTDAGVHALGQVAHCDLAREIMPQKLTMALNALSRPHNLVVLEAQPTTDAFHARFDALRRSYRYRILHRPTPCVFRRGLVWHVPQALDVNAMARAAHSFIGHHDLSSFRAAGCQASGPERSIDKVEVMAVGDEIHIVVAARSFLYHQVRNMVGALYEIGRGKQDISWIDQLLTLKDRTKGGATAPAEGLCFERVDYPLAGDVEDR